MTYAMPMRLYMIRKPLISVIVPFFNRIVLLREAVESVLDQTFSFMELILVDDNSTYGSGEYAKNSGARYIRTDHTGRPGKVRNIGARAARGEYLAFLDSDDLWKAEKLAKQVAFFKQNPDIRICHTREYWLRRGREISQSKHRHTREGYIFQDSLKKCIIGPSTVMLERSLFEEAGGFREDLEIAEDYELWLRLTANYPVGYIDEPLVIKRAGHADQLSEKYGQIEIFRIKALQLNLDTGTFARERKDLACRELVRKCRIYSQGCKKRGRLEEAGRYQQLAARYERKIKDIDKLRY